MMLKWTVFGACAACAAVAVADESMSRGRWTFSAGPAWRSQVKTRMTGGAFATPANAAQSGTKYDKDISDASTWGDLTTVPDPSPNARPGDRLWAVSATRTETSVTPGRGVADLSSADEHAPLGLNLSAGYDIYSGETLSFGLGLRVAAFFDMKSSATRYLDAGSIRTRLATDYFLFQNPPYPPTAPNGYSRPDATPHEPYREWGSDTTVAAAGSRWVASRYRVDLYQIALGPNVTWHALSWLDAYAGVEAILNLAAVDFQANGGSTTETDCLLGFGGHFGLEAYLTDSLGLYGQVSYEWVDTSEVSAGGIDGEADFSSLVLSAGVRFRF